MSTTPPVYPESEPRARARGLLAWILGDEHSDVEDRLAAGDALAALQDPLPADMTLAPAPETPGSLAEAQGLLEDASHWETTPRGIVAVSLALHHLRRVVPPAL
jgi:hypothetical protein